MLDSKSACCLLICCGLATLSACGGELNEEPPNAPGQLQAPVVIGADHRGVAWDFERSAAYHRADVAHLVGDRFALGVVRGTTDRFSAGEGTWLIYDRTADHFTSYGSLLSGVKTLRVTDSCTSGGQHYAWYAWERNGRVYINRLRSDGVWAGGATYFTGATMPNVVLGRHSGGAEKVLLLYEKTVGSRSYLYYRFLGCNGSVGAEHALRSVASPYYIWHAEASYNNHLDRWRIFWDEKDANGPATNMRTKYLEWWGAHSDSTYLLTCAGVISYKADPGGSLGPEDGLYQAAAVPLGGAAQISGALPSGRAQVMFPSPQTKLTTHPTDRPDAGYADEGCKRFFASYDGGLHNNSHRHLISLYARGVLLINENGTIDGTKVGDFAIPLTGRCNDGSCSYQEIKKTANLTYTQLSHNRFTDYFNPCDGADQAITPTVRSPYPLAMASGNGATVVLYEEFTSSTRRQLSLTVIDD